MRKMPFRDYYAADSASCHTIDDYAITLDADMLIQFFAPPDIVSLMMPLFISCAAILCLIIATTMMLLR